MSFERARALILIRNFQREIYGFGLNAVSGVGKAAGFPIFRVQEVNSRGSGSLMRLDVPLKKFVYKLRVNHLGATTGSYQEGLLAFTRILGILTLILGHTTHRQVSETQA